MMTSCCAILGLVFLVITNLCIIISFATPYWLVKKDSLLFSGGYNRGLWAYCDERDCTWVFQDNYNDHDHRIWWVAAQALMSFGLALGLLSLLLATMALCCECKGCNASCAVCCLLVISFIVMGVAVVIFGINAHDELGAELTWETNARFILGWSFWLGIASTGWAFLTSIIYGCEGRRSRI